MKDGTNTSSIWPHKIVFSGKMMLLEKPNQWSTYLMATTNS